MRQLYALLLCLTFAFCSKQPSVGNFESRQGKIDILRENSTFSPGFFTSLKTGDTINTMRDGLTVISFGNDAMVELQENSSLLIKTFSPQNKEIFLKKGAAWLKIADTPGLRFRIRTRDSVLGSPGHKVYVKILSSTETIFCHGEGQTRLYHFRSPYNAIHKEGDVFFISQTDTHLLERSKLSEIGIQKIVLDYSRLENSALGNKSIEADKQMALLLNFFRSKRN